VHIKASYSFNGKSYQELLLIRAWIRYKTQVPQVWWPPGKGPRIWPNTQSLAVDKVAPHESDIMCKTGEINHDSRGIDNANPKHYNSNLIERRHQNYLELAVLDNSSNKCALSLRVNFTHKMHRLSPLLHWLLKLCLWDIRLSGWHWICRRTVRADQNGRCTLIQVFHHQLRPHSLTATCNAHVDTESDW
jgi:hypothetical protein